MFSSGQMIAEKEIVMSKRILNERQTDRIYLKTWFPLYTTSKILERKGGGGGGYNSFMSPIDL